MESIKEEFELPNKMASLDIMELNNTFSNETAVISEGPEVTSRVLRKRKSLVPEINKPSKRRVNMKPRRHSLTENANLKQLEALYLNRNTRTSSQTLETIYEEPKTDANHTETFIGGKKLKRLLTFQLGNHYTKEKIKKRRAKIKKLLGNKSFLNRKKIPMPVFLKTIECLELDEAVQLEIPKPVENNN